MTAPEPEQPPSMAALFARAALTARGRGGDLPDTRLTRTGVTVDPANLAAYARVCRFPVADALPATYPHVLTFPLQLALMSDRAFPLALPGLVHVRNRIEALRPVRTDEVLDLEVWAERFATHRGGATVDLCASVSAGGAEVWRGRSTYLARGATAPAGAPDSDVTVVVGDLDRAAATWRVPADAGRRYAAVSGDVNPIHLSGLTAKAFGFKRAIAHGMWVKARVLASVANRLPEAFAVDVGFRKPLFLPSTVILSTAQADGGWDAAVRNATSGTEHLIGTVRSL
ncbi:MaoC family dehydratase [Blastococcus sp. VKM Ac-2987]|uniref:MaoC family dehydratase n=1 Tax=Blastococcus sp. VKM Ac-2987 TaxID=3004141 RepID=UPI0022AB7CF0|nr:MaoC/PaaZ C-terminal domain-containing protein [Blastococcus sp. VKM Ac-2987]MCZ2858545.1 MaoC/PaaZ C-terminal domain-containing protein [Blastococcus sp. VKM Ac-2987]